MVMGLRFSKTQLRLLNKLRLLNRVSSARRRIQRREFTAFDFDRVNMMDMIVARESCLSCSSYLNLFFTERFHRNRSDFDFEYIVRNFGHDNVDFEKSLDDVDVCSTVL